MELTHLIVAALGLAWASGLNLYAAMATLGILGATGQMTLPPDLQILAHPLVIGAALFMYCMEFFADKVPGLDTTWDTIHTFIRIPAGAVLAMGALGDVGPAVQGAALIIGGGIAAASHALKAGARVVINTSPEPFSNWSASLIEDSLVIGGLILAVFHPIAFLVLFAGFVALAVWLLPRIWRGIRSLWLRLRRHFHRRDEMPEIVRPTAQWHISLRPTRASPEKKPDWPFTPKPDDRTV